MSPLRPYTEGDREAARALLRRLVRRQLDARSPAFSIHPGDWDWWRYHPDPRQPEPAILIGDDALVERAPDGVTAAFTATVEQLADVLAAVAPVTRLGWVAVGDVERERVLADLGLTPDEGHASPLFLRLLDRLPEVRLPAGYTLRTVTAADAESRADAARLSFRSTMEPAMHRARYRRFMASPGYADGCDLAAFAPDGAVAAFAIVWPDGELGVGQFEPVGTHPDHTRRGLGKAVVTGGLHRLRELGMGRARVMTDEHRSPAVQLYLSCGFEQVGRLRDWARP